jgi:hypothetical protein
MQPFFLTENERMPVPSSWSRHIQRGRVCDVDQGDGRLLWEAVMNQAANQEKPALAFRESSHRAANHEYKASCRLLRVVLVRRPA